jgi:hypothetical protein
MRRWSPGMGYTGTDQKESINHLRWNTRLRITRDRLG